MQAHPLPSQPTLLDIGGGVGAIHHVLLERGFSQAVHVDASEAYLDAAADEARRLGHTERVQFHLAAFPAEVSVLPRVDVVTLHRVVCCDPDYVQMLAAAASYAGRILAFSYPRPRWVIRVAVTAGNVILRLLGRRFRAYVHPPGRMRTVLEGGGMRQAWAGGTWVWAVEVFERVAGELSAGV